MYDDPLDELERYERVRQRLIALIPRHPWLTEITIAVVGRKCLHCGKVGVVEHPAEHFLCTHCGESWANYPMVQTTR